jgi:YfiH family protein
MHRINQDSVSYLQFESLEPGLVAHAIFTRRGGVSPEPWQSLNVGSTVGDEIGHVRENLARVFSAVGLEPRSAYNVWQVHSAKVIIARSDHAGGELQKGDALITRDPSVTLIMRFADCVPILLHDPQRQAAGLVHAGWHGTVKKTASMAVRAMRDAFGTDPADIVAGIGPSIGPDHYAVREDVIEPFVKSYGSKGSVHLRKSGDEMYLDLWSANAALLEEEGVRQIEVARICTACHVDDWYSHRGESGRTGRFASIISLRP